MAWTPHQNPPARALYQAKPFLLSQAELRFFQALRKSVGIGIYAVAKVRLADVVSCTDVAPYNGTLARISQKHLDFVLVDEKYTRILAAIELDDSTHQRRDTIGRDRFVNDLLNSVGIPLLRVQAAGSYNPMVIRQQIHLAVGRRSTIGPRVRKAPRPRRPYRR